MNNKALTISAALVALTATTSAMATDKDGKGTFIPIVPVPNSASTNVFGVNDSNIITGSWLDASGVEHGYVGPLSGAKYKTFDNPNSTTPGTEPRGINDSGHITGFSNSQSGSTGTYVPFERDPKGHITEIAKNRSLLNYLVQGINNKNSEFAGSYVNTSLEVIGYLGQNGQYKKAFKVTGLKNTGYAGRGMNNAGDIVGWYSDANGVQHGLLVSAGTAQKLEPMETNMASSVLEGINNKGWITGQWTDTSGVIHAFFYETKSQKFRSIKVSGASSFTQAWGVSDSGLIAVGSDVGSFIYCPSGVSCPAAAHGTYKPVVKPKPQIP
jgi:hypothetical protein